MGLIHRAPVPPAQVLGCLRSRRHQGHHPGMGQHRLGRLLHPAPGRLGAAQVRRCPPGHLSHHVAASPGGGRVGQLGQALGDHRVQVHVLMDTGTVEDLGEPGLRGQTGLAGVGQPAVVQPLVAQLGLGAAMRLGVAGGQHRPLVGALALSGGQPPPEAGLELGDAGLGLGVGRPGPLGVAGEELLGDALDVGLAVAVHRSPGHAEAGGGLGAERRLVDHAGGLQLPVQGPGVQRSPCPVLAAHPSGDQDVGVQLGIFGSGGPVHEGGGHQAVGVDLADAGLALAGERRVLLQVGEPCGHRRVVGLPSGHAHLAATQRPES